METPTPNLEVAKKFKELVYQKHPDAFLAYNLSTNGNIDSGDFLPSP